MLVLERFAEANIDAVRDSKDKREYEEQKLRKFLRAALDEEVLKEFGDIPNITISN